MTAKSEVGTSLARIRRAWDVILKFHGLLVLLLGWGTGLSSLLSKPDVLVDYSTQQLFPPTIATSVLTPATPAPLAALAKSPELLRVVLENNLSSRVTDLVVRVNGVKTIADTSAGASLARLWHHDLARYELRDGSVGFPELSELPPKSTLILLIWGEFSSPFPRDRVQVSAAVSRIEVSEAGRVRGVRLFVAQNLEWIALLLTIYFLLVGLWNLEQS